MTCENVLTETESERKTQFLSLKSKIFTETPQMIGQRYMKGDCFFSQGSLII